MTNKSTGISPNSLSPFLALVTCILLYSILAWKLAVIRPAWCDEIFTHYHVTGGTWQTFWEKTESGLDRMPPLYFALCRLLFSTAENPILACRILSAITLAGGVIVLYHIFAMDLAKVWACSLALVTTFASDFFLEYSYEARPYAAGFLASTMLLWAIRRHETLKSPSARHYLGLGICCFLMPAFHYTYALTAVALGIGHLVIVPRTKHPRLIITYGLAGTLYAATHLPLLIEQSNFGDLLAMQIYPSLAVAQEFFAKTFDPAPMFLLLILLTLALFLLSRRRIDHDYGSASTGFAKRYPIMVFVALLATSLFGFFLARFLSGFWFLPRYYLPSLLAPAFLALTAIKHLPKQSSHHKLVLLTAFLGSGLALVAHFKEHSFAFRQPTLMYRHSLIPDPALATEDAPILTDDPVLFFCYLYRGVPQLHFVSYDTEQAKRIKAFLPEAHILTGDSVITWNRFLILETIGQPPRLSLEDYRVTETTNIKTDAVHKALEYERNELAQPPTK
jgi:hypothetical protein